MKVLVVEDSRKLQTSLGLELQNLGYAVDVANDGDQAIDFACSHDYDIIVLDLLLPKESSLLVLHEIRELNRDVEILILSARDQIHDRVTALIQGADDYLIKPFSCDELHARIQSLVRRKIGQFSAIEKSERNNNANAHLNRLIENLLKLCRYNQGEIELVISEIKLSILLERVCSSLRDEFGVRNITLVLPQNKLPTLLVDAKWMELLLINLLTIAITHCPDDAEVKVMLHSNGDYCALEIENVMAASLSRDALKNMVKEFCNQDPERKTDGALARFSLVKSYADCMNLDISAALADKNRLRIRLSKIKIV